jgi:hypothetical protein
METWKVPEIKSGQAFMMLGFTFMTKRAAPYCVTRGSTEHTCDLRQLSMVDVA